MTKKELVSQIFQKKSFLCVGLDTDIKKIPAHVLGEKDPVFAFNKQIIDATEPYTVAYKPNIAFYEAMGTRGWDSLQKTLEYIPKNCFTIADAKRGDIGNTSSLYARTFFDKSSSGLDFDSVTVAPYMGSDSVLPFLDYENKWVILLALTSNTGAFDFQNEVLASGGRLFEKVIETSQKWGSDQNMMYVVGATKADMLAQIRKIIPHHFLLVPGVGAQGGSLKDVVKYGYTSQCGLLVNASRSIIYASGGADFAQKAAIEAHNIQSEMQALMQDML